MKHAPALALALLVLSAPLASAGTADAPEVTDPAGDAGPNGAAAPAGFEDLDLVAAWFEAETVETVDLVIKTAGASRGRPFANWAQLIDVKGTSYVAGFISYPLGPLGFVGTYVCEASSVPDSCIPADGGVSSDLIRVTLPKANLSDPQIGDVLQLNGGVAEIFAGFQSVPVDTTDPGLPFFVEKGVVVLENGTAPAPGNSIGQVTGGANSTLAPTSAPASGENETPGLPALAAAALAASAALALRRRRA